MGTLQEFLAFVTRQRDVLREAEGKLLELQEKYESFFQEVQKAREHEFQQLRRHILEGRGGLPAALDERLDRSLSESTRRFDAELKKLERRHAELEASAEKLRGESRRSEEQVRGRNVDLDLEEEELKTRNEELLERIRDYNRRIMELGSGFGFLRNLFRMRALRAERQELEREQADVVARVDKLRRRWKREERGHAATEEASKDSWLRTATEASALRTKIEHLQATRERIVDRTAIEGVLFEHLPDLPEPADGDPACPRCRKPNPAAAHFCRICARRLVEDRPDLEGSLAEIAELNHHYHRFSQGMEACQGIIGLVRGLMTGHDNFAESVGSMIQTEVRHPVPKLKITVPKGSCTIARSFTELRDGIDPAESHHPLDFASRVEHLTARPFSESSIKEYFEIMGQELSKQAKKQW